MGGRRGWVAVESALLYISPTNHASSQLPGWEDWSPNQEKKEKGKAKIPNEKI